MLLECCRMLTIGDGRHKGDDQRHAINSELELQELAQVGEHAAAPQHRLDDAAEVVVHDDDVSSLLGHLRPCLHTPWYDLGSSNELADRIIMLQAVVVVY